MTPSRSLFSTFWVALCFLLTAASSQTTPRSNDGDVYSTTTADGGYERDFHRFVTRPDIDAPVWAIRHYQDESVLAKGYWFISAYNGLEQNEPGPDWLGPYIYDQRGNLVWSGGPAFQHWNVFDFRMTETVDGSRLTMLSGETGYIIDQQYRVQRTAPLLAGAEQKPDMHSFNVIDKGKRALIISNRPRTVHCNVSQRLGFEGPCYAEYQGFREMDLETGRPIFEWDAFDWITLNESTYKKYDGTVQTMCAKGWDILHFNSIDKFPNGDYILSSRHTDTIYKVSRKDGRIIWRLGGVKSDFEAININARFSRQHDARVLLSNDSHTILALFDNAIGDGPYAVPTYEYSRGLVLVLDTRRMTAEVLEEHAHPNLHRSNARGNFQLLPNGNSFLCWAYSSRISEHTPDGRVAMQAVFGGDFDSYRGFKFPWVGHPARPPDIHARAFWHGKGSILTVIHVSWNGATEVSQWKFEAIEDGRIQWIGQKNRTNFETRFVYDGFVGGVFATALDVNGTPLGKSEIFVTEYPMAIGEDRHRIEHANKTSHESMLAAAPLLPARCSTGKGELDCCRAGNTWTLARFTTRALAQLDACFVITRAVVIGFLVAICLYRRGRISLWITETWSMRACERARNPSKRLKSDSGVSAQSVF